jgi:DNA-binding response OmpR family regulator
MSRVLVVDDDLDTVTSLALVLGERGYRVRTAPDGGAALYEAAAFRPHADLLDIALPRMNGFELARRLRQVGLPALNIICVSGCSSAADRARSRDAGCDHHILKPAEPAELLRLLGPPTRPGNDATPRR